MANFDHTMMQVASRNIEEAHDYNDQLRQTLNDTVTSIDAILVHHARELNSKELHALMQCSLEITNLIVSTNYADRRLEEIMNRLNKFED